MEVEKEEIVSLSENEKYRVTAVNEDGKNTLFIKNLVNNSDVFVKGCLKALSYRLRSVEKKM